MEASILHMNDLNSIVTYSLGVGILKELQRKKKCLEMIIKIIQINCWHSQLFMVY